MSTVDAEAEARAAAEQAARDAVNAGGMPDINQEQLAWLEQLMTNMVTAAINLQRQGCQHSLSRKMEKDITTHQQQRRLRCNTTSMLRVQAS